MSGDWVGTGDWAEGLLGLSGGGAPSCLCCGPLLGFWTLEQRSSLLSFIRFPTPALLIACLSLPWACPWDYHPTPCQPPFMTPSSLTFFPVPPFKSRRNPSFPEASPSFSLLLSFHDRPRWPIRPDPQSPTGQVSRLPGQVGPDLPTFSVGKDKRQKQKQLKFHFTMVRPLVAHPLVFK